MVHLKTEHVQKGDIVQICDVRTIPIEYEEYVGVDLEIDNVHNSEISCWDVESGKYFILSEGEFKLSDDKMLEYRKQKHKLNL